MINSNLINSFLINDGLTSAIDLNAQLPTPFARFTFDGAAVFDFNAELPSLQSTFETGHLLNAQLPALHSQFHINVAGVFSLDAELPELQSEFTILNTENITLVAKLPTPQALFVFGSSLNAKLPALHANIHIQVNGVFSVNAKLPVLSAAFVLTEVETFRLDAQLPLPKSIVNLVRLDAQLPALNSFITFVPVAEALGGTAYVLNTHEYSLSEFANYEFRKLGMVRGVIYGMRDGKLYKITGNTDDGEPILGSLLTHYDDRVYNDIGELVRNDYLKRCLAVYAKVRTENGVSFDVLNQERNDIAYPLIPAFMNGVDTYRQDTYRGIVSQYWAFRVNTYGGDFDLENFSAVIVPLKRKVWG